MKRADDYNQNCRPPSVRVSLKTKRALYISKSALRCLGNPPYVRFLYVEGKNLLMMSGSDAKVRDSIAVPEKNYLSPDEEFVIVRKILTEAFRLRLNWEEGESYRSDGIYSHKLGMLVFELEKAVKIGTENEQRSGTGENGS
jgi:hypothetical protein